MSAEPTPQPEPPDPQQPEGDLWVFGYGSLMWNPGFTYAECVPARLPEHRRSFCLSSVRYRGTPESPGLVLALEPRPGMCCEGVAFRVAASEAAAAREYLHWREMSSVAYYERLLPAELTPSGQRINVLAYVMRLDHANYRGSLTLEERAAIIARSKGAGGPNREYLTNTLAALRAIKVQDDELERLAELVEAL